MLKTWRHSILFLSALAVAGAALIVGTLFTSRTLVVTGERLERQSADRLAQILDVVESTVRIACFVGDAALAKEVAHGLLQDAEVLGVVIRNDERELVRAYRQPTDAKSPRTTSKRLVRTVYSPFEANQQVGEIAIESNAAEVERKNRDEAFFVATLLVLQLLTLVVAVIFVMLRWVVRPIKSISDRLHRMDPERGDRVRIPASHARTEIGRLAEDINGLADRLVSTLKGERQLRQQREVDEKKYHAIFVNAETGIFIANRDGLVDSANPALGRLLNLPPADPGVRRNISNLPWVVPGMLADMINRCIDSNHPTSGDLELAVGDGDPRWMSLAISPLGNDSVQGLVSDITERKLAEDWAKQQAVTDHLTGIANRSGLESSLQRAIHLQSVARTGGAPGATGSDGGFALLLIDLDGFKKINDALGLPIGDKILQVAARRLRSCLKDTDTVARIGADEFAVALPNASHGVVARIGERIVRLLGQSYEAHTSPILLGASVGIALFPSDGSDLPALLRNAELALDRARATGGGRFAFFDRSMAEAAERRQAMEVDMQLALRRDEFRLYYQPIIDIASNRLIGAEALIRWRHKDKGMIAPDAFIPVAEETGLIIDIGLWGLETVSKQLALWRAADLDYYISLNVSGVQIPDGLPPAVLAEATRRHDIDPRKLVLEITEGVLLKDINRALDWLIAVRDLGFRIYLDDFGTGYSSLSYLKKFPVDTVKVDKSFVRDMSSDNNDRALVEAIIAMAKSLRLDVVAEGVETAAQLDLLRRMKCRSVQGYFFSRPVPIEEFEAVAVRIDTQLAAA